MYANKNITIHGYPAKELIYKQNATNIINKVQFVQVGNYYFEIMAQLPLELVEDSTVTAIFKSFQLLNPEKLRTINLFESKSALILQDLTAIDATTQARAKNALSDYHEFKQEDLPLLYKALERSYPDDTLSYGTTTDYLLEQFVYTSDGTTIPFLKAYYAQVEQIKYKESVLGVLVDMKTKAAITAFIELAKIHHTEIEYETGIYHIFLDSSQLFIKHYNELFALAKTNKFSNDRVSERSVSLVT